MYRIHVTACSPRSGTTLITEMMAACFEIDSYVEHESRIFSPPSLHSSLHLSKWPVGVMVIGYPLIVQRNLYVIYINRDPRDIVVSKHGYAPDKYWCGLNFWRDWRQYGNKLKGHPRFICIDYEDLVTDPDKVQCYLMKKMPFLKEKRRFSEYHVTADPFPKSLEALGGLRPVSAKNIGNWRKHKQRLAGQIKRHGSITKELIADGYEKDEQWLSELKDVVPDTRPSYLNEDSINKFRKHYLAIRSHLRFTAMFLVYEVLLLPIRNRR